MAFGYPERGRTRRDRRPAAGMGLPRGGYGRRVNRPADTSLPTYAVLVPASGLARLAGLVLAVVAGIVMIERGGDAIALVAIAFAVAVLAWPLVATLQRVVPRAAAIALVTLLGVAAVIAVVAMVTWDLDRQSTALSGALQSSIERLPNGGTGDRIATSLDLGNRVERTFDGAASRWVLGVDDPIGAAGEVARVVIVAVLAAFMISGGRHLVANVVGTVRRASRREALHRGVHAAIGRGGSYVRRTLVVSIAHGVVAGLLVHALGIPGAITIGAWVAVAITVPIVGGVLAWLPVVALAYATDNPWQLMIGLGLVAIAADRLARHAWVHRALRVGPLVALVGLAVGNSLLGVSGALVGLLMAAMAAALMTPAANDATAVTLALVDDEVEPVALEQVEARQTGPVLRAELSVRTAIAVWAMVVLAWAAFRVTTGAAAVLIWLVIGTFIAFGIDRPAAAVERRLHLHRVVAVTLVLVAMLAAAGGVIALSGPSVTDTAGSVVEDAPKTVESLESLPFAGNWLRNNDASDKVQQWIEDLPDRIGDSNVVDRVVSAAGSGIVGALWLIATLLAALLDGPRLVAAAHHRVPVERRRTADRLGRAAYRAISNVAAASAFVATLNGTVVMLLALALGVPLAPLLGLWAAAWNVIPQIGGFAGGMPLVVLAFGQSPVTGLIALGAFITYQTFENHVIQPIVGSRAVNLPPLVTMIGALVGGVLVGFVGAVLAGPALGVAKVVLTEVRGGSLDRVEDRRASATTG